jgi:hypothetical protein
MLAGQEAVMKRILAPALLILVVAVGGARAGVDVSFGGDVAIGDDANLFFSISSRHYDRDPRVVEDWGRRYFHDPDDLAVAMFLGGHCDNGPEYFFNLRKQGLGWFEISNRCRVPADVYFLPVTRDPGPPYGNAYGHWKKHKKDRKHAVVLSDADIRNLVAVRMAHEYYGVPVDVAMQWRSSGRDVRTVMNDEYRKRHTRHTTKSVSDHGDDDHGHGHKDDGDQNKGQGTGQGTGKDNSAKSHGKGNGNGNKGGK